MKRFFYCFTLFLFYIINLSSASNTAYINEILHRASKTEPTKYITLMFEAGYKNHDFRYKDNINSFSNNIILGAYKGNLKYQNESLKVWRTCMKKQNKYTEGEIEQVINISRSILGLK